MRYHLAPVSMATNKKSTNNKCKRGCREKGTSYTDGDVNGTAAMESSVEVP